MSKEFEGLSKDLKLIERELLEVWKALSQQEKRKQVVLHKMNRVKMILHKLIYSNRAICKTQDLEMGTVVKEESSQK